jgi:hypothetical protein|tara:strand:+ start:722 stop:1087 length:366 start_codon:yes stop_codon:yes gene_type:complete
MANPNLVAVTSINGKSINGALTTTTTTDLLTCASNKLLKVNTIIVANIDGTNSATVTMGVIKSGGSVVLFASTVAVPADSTLVLLDKNSSIYLEEGDILEGGASANSDLTYTISYEELDDA